MAERIVEKNEGAGSPKSNRKVLIAAISLAALFGYSAMAQTENPLAACRESSASPSERAACLKTAITDLLAGDRQESLPDSERIARFEAAIVALLGGEDALEDAASASVLAQSAKPQDEPEENKSSDATQQRLSANEAAAKDAPAGIGAEQVVAKQERTTKEGREKRKKRIKSTTAEARIIDFARTGAGKLILVLDNGQVWAQRTSDRAVVRLRDGDTPEVKIRRGALSGYRMEISDPNVTIIVERLK